MFDVPSLNYLKFQRPAVLAYFLLKKKESIFSLCSIWHGGDNTKIHEKWDAVGDENSLNIRVNKT